MFNIGAGYCCGCMSAKQVGGHSNEWALSGKGQNRVLLLKIVTGTSMARGQVCYQRGGVMRILVTPPFPPNFVTYLEVVGLIPETGPIFYTIILTKVGTIPNFHIILPSVQFANLTLNYSFSYGKLRNHTSSHSYHSFLSKVHKAPVKGRKPLLVSSQYWLSPLFAITPAGSALIVLRSSPCWICSS